MEEEGSGAEPSKFLLSHDDPERAVDPEMQARLEALLEAAGEFTHQYLNGLNYKQCLKKPKKKYCSETLTSCGTTTQCGSSPPLQLRTTLLGFLLSSSKLLRSSSTHFNELFETLFLSYYLGRSLKMS